MSQSRLMYHRWETDYKSQAKSGLFKVTIGFAISIGIAIFLRKKLIK